MTDLLGRLVSGQGNSQSSSRVILFSQGGIAGESAFKRRLGHYKQSVICSHNWDILFNFDKSQLGPSTNMIHLGLGICSETISFWILEKKRISFGAVRKAILSDGEILLKTMQRFVRKCQSFSFSPGLHCNTRECCILMSGLDDVTSRTRYYFGAL